MPALLQSQEMDMIESSIRELETDGHQLAAKFTNLLGVLREVKLTSESPLAPSSQESKAVDSAQAQLERIKNEREIAQAEYHTALAEMNLLEPNLETAKEELAQLKMQIAKTREDIPQLEAEKTRLESEAAKASDLANRLQKLQEQHRDVEGKMDALKAMEAKVSHMAKLGEETGVLMAKLWPSWLLSGELKGWKEALERKLFNESAPPSFGLLFAALHGYNAALRDPDPKTLYDNVRDVGRRLYQWLDDLGQSAGEAANAAQGWASAINAETANRCAVQVAVPGNPASNQWMIFTPRGGSAPDVAVAKSWCVLDAQRRPMHRAEVTV